MRGDYTYLQIANDIQSRIWVGTYTHKLPAERALAEEYGVAYQTVRRSMEVLRGRGLIITRQGRGTFVNPDAPPEALKPPPDPGNGQGGGQSASG
jgi:DNA-binding GntR family transcriptional regulator